MATLANNWRLYVGESATFGSGQFKMVSGELTSSFNLTCDLIETTTKESDWKSFLSGLKGATASATLYAEKDNAEQVSILKSFMEGKEVYCFWGVVKDPFSSEGYQFTALVNSISESAEKGGIVSRDISFTATGEVKRYPAEQTE